MYTTQLQTPQRRAQSQHPVPRFNLERRLFSKRQPLQLFERVRDTGAPIVEARFFRFFFVLLNRVDEIHEVFVRQSASLVKSRTYQGLRILLGEGLLTSEGQLWKRQRQLIQPAFHHRSVQRFIPQMVAVARETASAWASGGRTELDVHQEMVRTTLAIVGETLFSTRFRGRDRAMGEALETLLPFAEEYGMAAIRPPLRIPTQRMRRVRRSLAVIDRFVDQLLEERSRGERKNDLLETLREATDERGGMSKKLLRDEIVTLVAAGHETTASALTFTLYLLAHHPGIQDAVREEVNRVTGGEPLDAESLKGLELTDRVVREGLRLFPPAWAFERMNTESIDLGGYQIPPRTMIAISPYTLHRDPRYYPHPTRFDPARFLPEAVQKRVRHAYLPFGLGPRVCVGSGFALTEAKLILAELIRRSRVRPPRCPPPLVLVPKITIRPEGGLPLLVERA